MRTTAETSEDFKIRLGNFEHMSAAPDVRLDLERLGVRSGITVMMHGSLRSLGYVVGGSQVVIRSLLDVLGPAGTLVMPAFSPSVSDPAAWADTPSQHFLDLVRDNIPSFDVDTTPSEMGALSETFRRWPGTRRSRHPQVSVTARGPLAEMLVSEHRDEWGEGIHSPFERLANTDAHLLLIGVDFNRATMLHYAESLAKNRRLKKRRFPVDEDGLRRWVEVPDVGDDLNTHFPSIGRAVEAQGLATTRTVAHARCTLSPIRTLITFASEFLEKALAKSKHEARQDAPVR